MNDTKLKDQLTEAAKTARYLSRRPGCGLRSFADYHVEAFVTAALPMVKRLRAEVLAACSANVEETCVILLRRDRPKNEKILIAEACVLVQSRLEVFSPAAKDLEALLREAELKGRIGGFKDMLDDCEGFKGEGWKAYAREAIRTLKLSPTEMLSELEKARAILGELKR